MGGGGGKGGGGKVEVNDYYMSMHVGVCLGPVDALTGIYIGDKKAWEGFATTEQDIVINQPNLFGGIKKEGGVRGTVRWMFGKASNVGATMLSTLAARLGLTSDTCPAFTGVATMFFVGSTADASSGFYWGSNNPYLKEIKVRVRRNSNTFPAAAGEPSNYADMGGKVSNPAHMIYECLTNGEWGMGSSPDLIDVSSFQKAAKLFYQEGFGLAMIWTQQTTIEKFVSEILDHVQATLFLNPITGLLTLKPVRDDYTPSALKELNPDNCKITKFQRKTWGETINEITVSWTNPENEEPATYTQHDLANIEMQGGIVSDSRDYYAVRTAELAAKIAVRDMRTAAAPLATFEIDADRSMWGVLPGDVVRLSYPEYGIDGLVLRIGPVDYGKPGSSVVRIKATEDIFGLPQSAYTVPEETGWGSDAQDPTPLDSYKIITLPAYFAVKALSVYGGTTADYPEVITGVLGATENTDTRSYELYGEEVLPNSDIVWSNIGTKAVLARSNLTEVLKSEASTTTNGDALGASFATIGAGPVTAGFLVIGDGTEGEQEIALIDSANTSLSTIQLSRGVLDTVPKRWPVGTPVWFISDATSWANIKRFSAGGTAKFKATPSTSIGTLDLGSAPTMSQVVSARPHLPLRPANVKVNGVGFDVVFEKTGADLTVTWSNRNRLTEDAQVLDWTDGDVTPEAGQTTTVRVLDVDRNVIISHTGLTGTSFTLPRAPFASERLVFIQVTAVRDGLESLQGHEIRVSNGLGYGADYGNNYGGI